jgi:hypothetical protein
MEPGMKAISSLMLEKNSYSLSIGNGLKSKESHLQLSALATRGKDTL